MLTHREFSSWIVSEGKPFPEYLIAVDRNARKVSCRIPGQAEKSFSLHWKDGGTCTHSCTFISLDGFFVPGRFLFGYGEASREGVRTGLNTERLFVFMEQSSGGRSNADAGTIALKIRCHHRWFETSKQGTAAPRPLKVAKPQSLRRVSRVPKVL